mgnify:CR=1 FL=1
MKEKKTVFFGDSITRGYGVSSGEGWVELLHRGKNINHGIDGDTTAGMLRRFSAHVVREQPERVVIKLLYKDELTPEQAAQKLGVTSSTIRSHKKNALDKLKKEMLEDD